MRKTVVAVLLLAAGSLAPGAQEARQDEMPETDAAGLCAFIEANPLKAAKEIGGRWVRLKEKANKVVAPEKKGDPGKLVLVNRFDSSPSVIECSFDPKQAEALRAVAKDAVVRLRGKLDRYNQSTIFLKQCELVVEKK
jgi:hypothetical protein